MAIVTSCSVHSLVWFGVFALPTPHDLNHITNSWHLVYGVIRHAKPVLKSEMH